MAKIELITCDDWAILKLDGRVYDEGHSISNRTWLALLRRIGNDVEWEEVDEDEMAELSNSLTKDDFIPWEVSEDDF